MKSKLKTKSIFYLLVGVGLTVTTSLWATTGLWAANDALETISFVVDGLDKLYRVTETPHPMADSTAALCDLNYNPKIHEGTGKPAYCHVYVTRDSKESMISGKGSYPIGTVIVKAKLENEKSKDAILFTVMRKMSQGYDSEHGDWEYSVVDGPSKRVLASGKIDSCINCHQEYSASDYVTRIYMEPIQSKK